jgi:hypothetical protein
MIVISFPALYYRYFSKHNFGRALSAVIMLVPLDLLQTTSSATETSHTPLVLPTSQLCAFEPKVDPCYAPFDLGSVVSR